MTNLSIVIPSFNQVKYLNVLLQGLKNFECYIKNGELEIIVLDGGSTDGSKELIQSFSYLLSFWRSRPDGGQASAVNEGFAIAKSKYLVWQNSDDLFNFDLLEKLLSSDFISRSNSDLIIFDTEFIDPQGVVYRKQMAFYPFRVYICKYNLILNQSCLLHSRVYSSLRLESELRFCMDLEYFARIVFLSGSKLKIQIYHETLGYFRDQPASKTRTISSVHDIERSEVVSRYINKSDVLVYLACGLRKLEGLYRYIFKSFYKV